MDNYRDKPIDNSLYRQLQKDLKKKKNRNRVYVPIAVFCEIPMEKSFRGQRSLKDKVVLFLNTILK